MLVAAAIALAGLVVLFAWRLAGARGVAAVLQGRMAAVLAHDASGLAVWSADGRLIACNGRFREFYSGVTLKRGLEWEDLIRYTATRAVVLIPESEIEAWVTAYLGHLGTESTETHRTPDGRWIEIRTRRTAQSETLLIYTDVTAARTADAVAEADDGSGATDRAAAAATAALAMLQAAVALGRESASFHASVRDLLPRVCAWGGWDAATTYLAAAEGDEPLISTGSWHVVGDGTLTIGARAAIDACCGDIEDHVLHRAVTSNDATWVAAIAIDPRLSDTRRAALGDFRSLCAVPVSSAGQVIAVVELFARAGNPPDAERQRLLADAAAQLARVFERERGALAAATDGRT